MKQVIRNTSGNTLTTAVIYLMQLSVSIMNTILAFWWNNHPYYSVGIQPLNTPTMESIKPLFVDSYEEITIQS